MSWDDLPGLELDGCPFWGTYLHQGILSTAMLTDRIQFVTGLLQVSLGRFRTLQAIDGSHSLLLGSGAQTP